MKTVCGFTLLETLISVVLTAVITTGLLFFLKMGMSHNETLQERSDIYREAGRIMNMIRADLSTAAAVTDMEYFDNVNGDAFFNYGTATGSGDRIIPGNNDSWKFNLDDPWTFNLKECDPPIDDPDTNFDESLLNYENLPYGRTYDYVAGITNSGNLDVIYFRGSITRDNKKVPANICYRLVRKKASGALIVDTGTDGKADEDEAGFHPVANVDPKYDNYDPVFNGTATEMNGFIDRPGESGEDGDAILSSERKFELQRIVTTWEDNKPVTGQEILSKSVVAFDIFYYDRRLRQYTEPRTTIKRFSYPPDVGVVGRFGTQTPHRFSFGDMSTEYFINHGTEIKSIVSKNDHVFLWDLWENNIEFKFNTYEISEVYDSSKKVQFKEFVSPPVGPNTAVQFIPAGVFDAGGMLFCPAVKDNFVNLKAGDRVFLQQWNSGKTNFAVKPDLYTIINKRGNRLVLDLKGQEPVTGTGTVFFRAAYLPPGIKIHMTWRADRLSENRGKPSYISLSNTIALQE